MMRETKDADHRPINNNIKITTIIKPAPDAALPAPSFAS